MAMQLQEIFNTAVSGILVQGRKATDGTGMCTLRGWDGTRCAVGHLIKDEDYNSDMEGFSFLEGYSTGDEVFSDDDVHRFAQNSLGEALIKSIGELTVEKMNLLNSLQDAHDNWPDDLALFEDLTRIAKEFELDDTVVATWAKDNPETKTEEFTG